MIQYKLGRSIATIVPFHRVPMQQQQQQQQQQQDKDDGLIGSKTLILMSIIAIASVLVLLL